MPRADRVSTGQAVPSATEVRDYLRAINRIEDHRSWLRRCYDSSDSLLGAFLLIGLIVEAVRSAVDAPRTTQAMAGAGSTQWLVVLLALTMLAATLRAALAVGPVFAGMATLHWVLGAPVDRRQLLLRRWIGVLGAGAAAGALAGALLSLLRPGWLPNLPFAMLAGLAAGLSTMAFASWCQAGGVRVRLAQRATLVCLAVLVLAAVAVLVADTAAVAIPAPGPPIPLLAALCGLLAIPSTVAGYRALGRLHRGTLSTGTELADAALAASSLLEPSMLSHALTQRRWRRIGVVRSVSLRGTPRGALLLAELARLRRRPALLAAFAAAALLPYAAALPLDAPLIAPVQALAAFLVVDRLASGLRTISRSAALRRTIGGSDTALRAIHLVLPAAGALVFCAVTAPALPVLYCAPVSAAGAVLVSYRIATRPPMDYSSPLVDTGLGPLPINIVRQLSRGPAVLLALLALQLWLGSG